MKYKIITPNPLYNGVTEGVPFASGVGHTDDENVKNSLVNNYGYKCEPTKSEEKPKPKGKASGK
ncbi:MAG: hypothetical protein ACQEXB_24545 [Bacillota bacterium]